MKVKFTHTDMLQIVKSIWTSVLTREIQCSDETTITPGTTPILAGCIQLTGGWNGAVALHCSSTFIRQAASVMFSLEEASIAREDMRDALGELVNMVGGGVKSLFSETCVLSLPTVVEEEDFTVSMPGSSLVQKMAFQSQGESILVTLLEKSPL